MTKLEQKLFELGYEYYALDMCYRKKFTNYLYLIIDVIDDEVNELCCGIKFYEDLIIIDRNMLNIMIDVQQLAFNEMQKDLEELKKYEDKNI